MVLFSTATAEDTSKVGGYRLRKNGLKAAHYFFAFKADPGVVSKIDHPGRQMMADS